MGNVLSVSECIKAGYSSIVIQTAEESRAITECLKAGDECNKKIFLWSCTNGLEEIFSTNTENSDENMDERGEFISKAENSDLTDPQFALEEIRTINNENGDYIICFLDFQHYINNPLVLREAKDGFSYATENGVCIVFISNKFEIPSDWEDAVVSIELRLPNKQELKQDLSEMVDLYKEQLKVKDVNQLDELVNKAAEIALGLTISQAENAFATSFSKKETIDLHIISEVKAQIICKDGLLEFWDNEKNVEVGGMLTFKDYTQKRLLAFSDEAKKYGLPNPKGVLLVGIPGCGKSLAAKALAQNWNVPLIKCDLGKLFGSYVGDTEANTRKALKTAEAMAPCVLWIDEIEKGLAGAGSGGKNDSGVSSRMFASILTWMQEKEAPVYVIATANSIMALPQELLRKGRFDEIFFVDLPNEEERKEIINIQLKKKSRKPEDFNIDSISKKCEKFTGAEIEEAVVSAMFNAYSDNGREIKNTDIISAMESIKPAAEGIMEETVKNLQNWAKEQGVKNANSLENKKEITTTAKKKGSGRQIYTKSEGGNA